MTANDLDSLVPVSQMESLQFKYTARSLPCSQKRHPEEARPVKGTNRDSSVQPDAVTRGYNTLRRELPSPKTFPPVRTVVDAATRKVRCQEQETKQGQSFGSAPRLEPTPNT